MDDFTGKVFLFFLITLYLYQAVLEFYIRCGEGECDDEDECEDEDKDKSNEKVILVYEEKYLKKIRNKKETLNENILTEDKLKSLLTNYVIEYTPVGNVLMYYNYKRECFEYYSDSTVPYRYLEVVSRKYVLMNNCISLYFDMEKELKQCEKIDYREKKEEEEVKAVSKNVFAKFKSYNKEGGNGHISTAPPPKNNISQVKTNNSEKICLKENVNRYSRQGKMLNFSMLQKIDRKIVDQKFAITYADFKRLKKDEVNI